MVQDRNRNRSPSLRVWHGNPEDIARADLTVCIAAALNWQVQGRREISEQVQVVAAGIQRADRRRTDRAGNLL